MGGFKEVGRTWDGQVGLKRLDGHGMNIWTDGLKENLYNFSHSCPLSFITPAVARGVLPLN